MSFSKKILVAAAMFSVSLGSAFARSATDAETTAFKSSVANYAKAMNNNNFEQVIDSLPPSIYQALSKADGEKSPEEVKNLMLQAMKQSQTESGMKFSDVKPDLNSSIA